MKVQYRVTRSAQGSGQHAIVHWTKGAVWEIRDEGEPTFCCDAMREAWGDGAVGLGERDTLNKIAAVCIYVPSIYPEGTSWNEYPVAFCPFCVEPIELEQLEPDRWVDHNLHDVPAPEGCSVAPVACVFVNGLCVLHPLGAPCQPPIRA